jgi:hypothetical protein
MSGSGSTSTSSSASPYLVSSRSTATNTSSTPSSRQSPILSQSSRSQSFTPKSWSSDTKTTRRLRRDSYTSEREVGNSKKRSDNIASSGDSIISSRDDWWEHVLPPGQLAERLRKAQVSSTTSLNEEGPKSSRKSILRNATPSERKTWTSFADIGQSKAQQQPGRSGVNSTRSSVGSLPSIKSDISSISATSSSTEDNAIEAISPISKEETLYNYDRSSTSSPPLLLSVHRSTSLRRSRVVGDQHDNSSSSSNTSIGLGLGGAKGSDIDERLRLWNFNTAPAASPSPHNNLLRPFPSTVGGRQSPLHVLEDTPEVSSEEEQGLKRESVSSSTSTVRTYRRTTRTSTSSVRTLDNLFDGQNILDAGQSPFEPRRGSWQNPSDRHVSFRGDSDEQWQHQTIGRAAGRVQSMMNNASQKRQSWHPEGSRRNTKAFPSSGSSDAIKMQSAPQSMHNRDRRRTTCYSAPTSPRMDLHSLPSTRTTISSLQKPAKVVKASSDNYDPQLALYSSLGLTQTRMASAGNLASTLTRQLIVPLRPMLQLTMFLSISSFTMMALAGFLIAGYLITVFDDVNHRGKQIQSNVNIVTRKMEAGLHWCEKLITGGEEESVPHRSSSSIVTAPIRLAFAVPTTIAYKLTPTSVSESFGFRDGPAAPMPSSQERPSTSRSGSQSSQSSKSSKQSKASSIPPRPPLTSLLPSIFLTIMIALGAGLANFFVGRASTTPTFATTPLSPSAMPPRTSSHIPIRKRSSVQTQPRRHSYDIAAM